MSGSGSFSGKLDMCLGCDRMTISGVFREQGSFVLTGTDGSERARVGAYKY